MSTPTATGAESGGGDAVCPAVVLHGEPLTDRKSTFQAHAAQVKTTEQVSQQFLYVVLGIAYTDVGVDLVVPFINQGLVHVQC